MLHVIESVTILRGIRVVYNIHGSHDSSFCLEAWTNKITQS